MQMQISCVYRPYKDSISKEVNNDNINLHSMIENCRAGFATVSFSFTVLFHCFAVSFYSNVHERVCGHRAESLICLVLFV